MNEKNQCPKCGAAVPANAPEGLCPRCLGALNLEPDTVVSGAEAAAAWDPPPASELGPLFPQLELLGLIGRGGMGVVYKARQKELDRIVALKVLPPVIGSDPAFAERFAREAKALARLNHPGIVTVHDFGRAGGLFYFLMEFVDGVSLRQLMNTGRVSPREALAIVPQICDALQYAHDQGIVHRDIKPENILLDRLGRVKVADFGLAKLVQGTDASPRRPGEAELPAGPAVATSFTEAGKVLGTPQYMAPEQAERPSEVDHRADIYALGMVFYQMLTGELPGQRIEPPSHKVQIDVRLDEVVLRALEKEPERRYQQVSEVRTAVETIIRTPPLAGPRDNSAMEPPPPAPRPAPARRTGVGLAILGVCLVLLLAALFSLAKLYPRKGPALSHGPARPDGQTNSPGHALRLANIVQRESTPTNAPLPTVAQILTHYAQAKGEMAGPDKARTIAIKGVFTSRDGLGPMEAEAFIKAPDKWFLALKNTNGPAWRRGFDGAVGWEISPWGPPQVVPSILLVARVHISLYRGDSLAALLPQMSLKGLEPISGGQAYVVEVALPGQAPKLWFDRQTGLLVRIEYAAERSVMQMDCDDYRDVGGLMLPFKLRQTGMENWTIECREVRLNDPIDDSVFVRPPGQ